jgi:hypothetical protein
VRVITALVLFILFMLAWYVFVEYGPGLVVDKIKTALGVYNQYIAAPSPDAYWQWYIIVAIAVVAGYVAHRER